MAIQFNCIQCNKTIETPDDTAGKKCRCPECGQVMPIPAAESTFERPFVDPSNHPQKNQPDYSSNPYAAPPSNLSPSQPPMHLANEPPDRSGIVLAMGITSIVVALMSCGCCFIFFPVGLGLGIPAWMMARKDLKEITRGDRNPSQASMLQAGMICGIVGAAIATVSLIVHAAMLIFNFAAIGMDMAI